MGFVYRLPWRCQPAAVEDSCGVEAELWENWGQRESSVTGSLHWWAVLCPHKDVQAFICTDSTLLRSGVTLKCYSEVGSPSLIDHHIYWQDVPYMCVCNFYLHVYGYECVCVDYRDLNRSCQTSLINWAIILSRDSRSHDLERSSEKKYIHMYKNWHFYRWWCNPSPVFDRQ